MAFGCRENESIQLSNVRPRLVPHGVIVPFLLVTALFFLWGIPNNLNDVLIRQFMKSFSLSRFQAGLVQSAFYMGYFMLAAPAAILMRKFGYKLGFIVGLLLFGIGAFLFWPAANIGRYEYFLAALFVIASGLSFLETASNPFIAQLGAPESAARRLNLAQAFNSIGGTIAPLVAGAFILTDPGVTASKASIANTVRGPYIAIAAALLILGFAVALSHLPPVLGTRSLRPGKDGDAASSQSIWSYRHTVLGAVGIFFYVGVEVGLASIAVNYFKTQGMSSTKTASFLVSLYWFGALVGRLLGSWILTKVKAGKLLGFFGIIAAALIAISMISSGQVAIGTLVLCGFFNSVMFPNIFTLGIAGLGPMTGKGSGLLMTAVVGGAVVPYLLGALADKVGIQQAFFLPTLCYLYIAYYGLSGSKPARRVTAQAD